MYIPSRYPVKEFHERAGAKPTPQNDNTIKKDRRNYKNVFDAFIRTTKEEGVGALYKGLMPNILL
mgnify:CR=1 FL=1